MHRELRAGGPLHAFAVLAVVDLQHGPGEVDGDFLVAVGRGISSNVTARAALQHSG